MNYHQQLLQKYLNLNQELREIFLTRKYMLVEHERLFCLPNLRFTELKCSHV